MTYAGSFYKQFPSEGLFRKNFLEGFIFLGCRHCCYRKPYSAIAFGETPQRVTPSPLAAYMWVTPAAVARNTHACMHAPHPMHTWPPLHATTWVTPIWLTEYPCMWLRQSLWRNIDSPCAPANTSGEMPLIYRVNRQFSP